MSLAKKKVAAPKKEMPDPTTIHYSQQPTPESSSEPEHELKDFGAPFIDTKPSSPKKPFLKGAIIILVIAIIAGIAGYLSSSGLLTFTPKKQDTFYAVFLTNRQVYFGVIEKEKGDYLVLDKVFYIQTVSEQVPSEEEGGTPQVVQRSVLVKKGEEFYGPENLIRINRNLVTSIEELREDSQVVQDIQAKLAD